MFPLKDALRFPFVFGGKVCFENLDGRVMILSDVITFGMVKVGFHGSDMFGGQSTIFHVEGELIINGDNIKIGYGDRILISQNGQLKLETGVCLGAKNTVCCGGIVEIKQDTITSWNCEISNHSSSPLVIGKHSWLGNNTKTIGGCKLPQDIIVPAYGAIESWRLPEKISGFSLIGGGKTLKYNIIRQSDKL